MRRMFLTLGTVLTTLTAMAQQQVYMFVGSYAPSDSEGIALYSFDQNNGQSKRVAGLLGVSNPSFVTFDPERSLLYSVGEDAGNSSTVNTISVDLRNRSMRLVDSKPTHGGAPCHVALSPDRNHVLTANYMGGSATCYALDGSGVPTGEPQLIQFGDSARQSHAHFATFTPDGRRLWVTDLGLDRIHSFPVVDGRPLLERDKMLDIELPKGAGPRHVEFNNASQVAYVLDELDGNINVINLEGPSLRLVQRIVADSLGAHGRADIHMSPDGRYLYASNRLKGDGIAIFKIVPGSGLLGYVSYQPTGSHPRNFAITPNGRYMLVACRDSNAIEVYSIDPRKGTLSPTKQNISFSKPVCVQFVR